MSRLEKVIIEPNNSPEHSIIWLHGLGADGHDFVPIVEQLQITNEKNIRFIFPHAPVKPVTINNGMEMRAWYDITGFSIADKQDRVGIEQSLNEIHSLIESEISKGISSQKIVLAGFSQGGAVALQAGLRASKKLAGIIALSTYLPLHENFADDKHHANLTTPIFMAHGTFDPVVPIDLGEISRKVLEEHEYSLQWQQYPMQHEVCMEEIRDIDNWLKCVLSS